MEKQIKLTDCNHSNLLPYEYCYAKIVYPEGYKSDEKYYDFTASVVTANAAIVKKYLCINCKTVIKAKDIING